MNIFKVSIRILLLSFVAQMVVSTARAQVVNNAVGTGAVTVTYQQFEIGPTLDVVPYVLADGYTINLTLIPELLEFDGYDTPPAIPAITAQNVVQLPVVLPHFTVREVATTVNIWDNQTVVLGGLISSSIQNEKDKVPFLGDLPVVGRLFQSQSKVTEKKNLMIFVTATIIDPAGNRVHSDDELPFNPPPIPAQPNVSDETVIPQNGNSPMSTVIVTPAQ
jgi:general secretion pathway protein D